MKRNHRVRIDLLNNSPNTENSRGDYKRLLAPNLLCDGPHHETSSKSAGLLESDCERIYSRLVGFGVLEIVDEGGGRQDASDFVWSQWLGLGLRVGIRMSNLHPTVISE
jgi:hypothetical protein